jgi:hypothetical protein
VLPIGPAPQVISSADRFALIREDAWLDWFDAAAIERTSTLKRPAFGHFVMAIQAAIEGRDIALSISSTKDYYFVCRKSERALPTLLAAFFAASCAFPSLRLHPPRVRVLNTALERGGDIRKN